MIINFRKKATKLESKAFKPAAYTQIVVAVPANHHDNGTIRRHRANPRTK